MSFRDFMDQCAALEGEAVRQHIRQGGLDGEYHHVIPSRVYEPRLGQYLLCFSCPNCETQSYTQDSSVDAVLCPNCGDSLIRAAGAA